MSRPDTDRSGSQRHDAVRQPDTVYLDFNLLDRQIVDSDGMLVGNVDDLELQLTDDGRLQVVALLSGQRVLGERIGGLLGRWMAAVARRLAPTPDPAPLRIPYRLVDEVGSEVTIRVSRDALPEPPLETWLRRHLIERIPGADHESQ
jgi:sporulation protein YlmC with PRC-barrel domain